MPVDPEQQATDIARFHKWGARVQRLGHVLRRIEYVPEVIPPEIPRGVLMVANHRSLADVFVAIEALHHYDFPARCLVRAKYFETPGVGTFLTALDCIPAGDGKRASIQIATDTLRAGRPVAVMIEGKIVPPDRREVDGMGEIRPGFIEIARTAGVDILPIALIGADAVWTSRGKGPRIPWRGRAKVQVRTGELVSVEGRTDEEIISATREVITRYLAESSLS